MSDDLNNSVLISELSSIEVTSTTTNETNETTDTTIANQTNGTTTANQTNGTTTTNQTNETTGTGEATLGNKSPLQTITLDNAASNDVAVSELIRHILQDLIDVENKIFHNYCLAHILNLIVKDGLKKISEGIKMIYGCVKAIHISPKWHQMFVNACKYESVKVKIPPLDCETRWNSMFLMLQLAIELKAVIIRLKDKDRTFPDVLSKEEWEKAKSICGVLELFYECKLISRTEMFKSDFILKRCVEEKCEIFEQVIKRCSASIESSIACAKNNHIDDYYEYMIKKNQVSQPDTLYEVRRYLDEQWKNNDQFPNLTKMACDFLAVPATSVASEQMFICAEHVIDDYCTSLDPETVTVLMCQRNWLEMAAKFGWDL
ncbi:14662_t:CDS:2 [Dentiscutata erythropus]|uniref:14662_t:CDS:1 n=1 Tax=Dentiscutata erythropus TaxID=1348616 RepID=A0A9N8V7C8_9GLOM|nr:14662_t:CDS:2 [Dentiscutata erythropus]